MANILNAGTNGLTITGSSSAALNIQVGGTNALQIGTAATATLSTTTFPSGTASAPAIAITGDTDTGIYAPAANQLAVSAGGTVAAAFNSNGLFFRNRIINGDMRIDQRNAGASITLSTTTQYPVDRFPSYKGTAGATVTAQQSSTAPTGFTNSIVYTASTGATPAAGDINGFWHVIEGFNVADLGWGTASAQTVTLSFWIRSSVTGTYSVSVSNSPTSNRWYVATYTINSANTYEYKTITIPGDTTGTWNSTNTGGLQVIWDLGYGTNFNGTAGSWGSSSIRRTSGSVQLIATTGATLYITGVQLETGSVATPFERRPYTTELQLCQRYCLLLGGAGGDDGAGAGIWFGTTVAIHQIRTPVTMRAAPTLTNVSPTLTLYVNGGVVTSTTPTINTASQNSVEFYTSGASVAVTAGDGTSVRYTAGKSILNSEL